MSLLKVSLSRQEAFKTGLIFEACPKDVIIICQENLKYFHMQRRSHDWKTTFNKQEASNALNKSDAKPSESDRRAVSLVITHAQGQ